MDIDGMVADILRLKTQMSYLDTRCSGLEIENSNLQRRLTALEVPPLGVGPEGEGHPAVPLN